jgi:general secretion pathway protein G
MRQKHGFTLIEILIVVLILGILAGIVIPQFAGATQASKVSSVSTTANTLRSAVQLYYYQHSDTLPTAANFWNAMTTQTDATGAAWTNSAANLTAGGPFGPYMQSIPANATNQLTTVIDANVAPGGQTAAVCGWLYDYNGGTGSAIVHGTAADQKTVLP